ncbi:MAG: imidazole glycerol phosphate synthase subunit HisH [Anaerolineae bacterium]|nr:imidazole glycerol phosphate synthase subunit HisH [Candidatus Roseilinea sp.]MDW8451701.1 imidazole glycerol phosphate synthase subunit HisH [Anaerolineae bacterium]
MIAVIDYGAGNLRNVCKALEHVGAELTLTDDRRELERADKLVLPGVGAFADCQHGLKARGLFEPLRALALAGKPLLGICVGMQLLFEVGEEMGEWEGLGLIPGRVVRFHFSTQNKTSKIGDEPLSQFSILNSQFKIPHIGWNQLWLKQPDHPLLAGVRDGDYAYFVHSYHPRVTDPAHVLAVTDYGYDFPSVVARGNVWGIQFHPEKSQDVGLRMLRNFVAWPAGDSTVSAVNARDEHVHDLSGH